MSETNDITLDEIKAICHSLRAFKKSWVKLLADYIKDQEHGIIDYTAQKVYNVYLGITSSQDERSVFMKHAITLLTSFKEEKNEVNKMIKKALK